MTKEHSLRKSQATTDAAPAGPTPAEDSAGWVQDDAAAPGELVPISDHTTLPLAEDDRPARLVVSGPGVEDAAAPPPPSAPTPGLELALFDSELGALPAAPAPPPPPREAGAWPGDVLGQEEALRVLTGVADPEPRLKELTRGLFASLTEVESAALWGHPLPFDAEPLRNAILMRYRLAVAVALKPGPEAPVDHRAMDDLVAATDLVLSTLAPPPDADPAVQKAFDATRAAVARDAVAIAEVAKDASAAAARAAAQEATQKYAKVQQKAARIRSYQVQTASRPRRRLPPVPLAFGLVVAAGVLFHGARWYLGREGARASSLPGLPANTVGARDSVTGVTMVRPQGSKRFDPGTLKELQQQAAQEGKAVQQLGPDHVLILPQELAPPADLSLPGRSPHGPP